MTTAALTHATCWLSERLPDAQLADLAAMLELGLSAEPVRLTSLVEKLGMSLEWADGFVERQARHQGGLAPLVDVIVAADGKSATLSPIGHNILNQFWQRTIAGEPANAW
jgi:hypothetical protein